MAEILLPIGIVALFYFILMRPVIKQQKQHRRDISNLDVGDEVLTTGGFYATVREISHRDDGRIDVVLEVAAGVLLRGTPAAVQQIVAKPADHQPAAAEKDAGS
jgi:preprotein translocase subunit YajC